MEITRSSDRGPRRGPAEWFTGEVHLLELAWPGSLLVTFAPGARTAWHTHPNGQALHIVAGVARVGGADGAVRELQPGDRVEFGPGERHWHGAGPDGPMTHVALARPDDGGQTTDWEDHVTDADYDA